MSDNKTEAETIHGIAVAAMDVRSNAPGFTPFVMVPNGYSVKKVEDTLPSPPSLKAFLLMSDEESFSAYINKHKKQETVLFLNSQKKELTAIIDYHDANSRGASWCEHRVLLPFELNKQFEALFVSRNKYIDREQFVDFIEDNVSIFARPSGTDFLEIAERLQGMKQVSFAHGGRRQNGDREFLYKEETTASAGRSGSITIPESVVVKLPIFDASPAVEINCSLRFKIDNGGLSYNLRMPEIETIIDAHVVEAAKRVSESVAIPLYMCRGLSTWSR